MTERIDLLLERYGQMVVVCSGDGEEPVRAFLQPAKEKRERLTDCITELGHVDERLWVYLGKYPVKPEDRIIYNEDMFRVRSSRPYYVGDEVAYWWAGLDAAKEMAE